MKNFQYSGPFSGVTLNIGTQDKPESLEVLLSPGCVIGLPEQHEYTQTLQALGYLTPVSNNGVIEPDIEAEPSSKPKKEANNAS